MEKVIKNASFDVAKYQFKPFDAFALDATDRSPKYSEKLDDFQPLSIAVQPKQVMLPTNEQHLSNEEPQNAPVSNQQNELVENLLQKIDELSSNMIKMEMQMERQQHDFNARLDEERNQARELGANEARMQSEAQYNDKIASYERMIFASVKKLDDTTNIFGVKMDEIERDLTQTALQLAQEVIKQEVSQRSSAIAANLASELLAKIKGASNVTVKVNNEDLEGVKAILGDNPKISISADEAISKGGVIVLSEAGNLDGQLCARFEKIKHEALN